MARVIAVMDMVWIGRKAFIVGGNALNKVYAVFVSHIALVVVALGIPVTGPLLTSKVSAIVGVPPTRITGIQLFSPRH